MTRFDELSSYPRAWSNLQNHYITSLEWVKDFHEVINGPRGVLHVLMSL